MRARNGHQCCLIVHLPGVVFIGRLHIQYHDEEVVPRDLVDVPHQAHLLYPADRIVYLHPVLQDHLPHGFQSPEYLDIIGIW